MAKFQLNSGETLIGSGMMSIYLKQGLSKKPFQGKHLYHKSAGVFQNQYGCPAHWTWIYRWKTSRDFR